MKIAIAGANGRMGRMLVESVLNHHEFELSAALGMPQSNELGTDASAFMGTASGILITDDLNCLARADCLIDFTRPEGSLTHLEYCLKYNVNMVVGTTGFDEAALMTFQKAAEKIAIVLSPNMSIGVNVVYALLEQAARSFDDNYDIEIFEAHHRNKVDAPSGTALMMGEVAAAARGTTLNEVADWARHGHTGVREKGHIGFSVLRGGDLIGEHVVSFCGPGERIEIAHKASNRQIYAYGSLQAARFLKGKTHGYFSMRDVVRAG